MTSETHAYGTALGGLVSRRHFVLIFSLVMSVYCFAATGRYLMDLGPLRALLTGDEPPRRPHEDCTGDACYKVVTCFGTRKASMHLLTPVFPVLGLIFFPIGAWGAQLALHKEVQTFSLFITAMAILHVVVLVLDGLYVESCTAYPENMMDSVTGWPSLAPISLGVKGDLGKLSVYPMQVVATMTGNLNVRAWYYVQCGIFAVILVYAAAQALVLANLVEMGPLGLGTHFGISAWEEILQTRGLSKRWTATSKFLDDAKLSGTGDSEVMNYGSLDQAAALAEQERLARFRYLSEDEEAGVPQTDEVALEKVGQLINIFGDELEAEAQGLVLGVEHEIDEEFDVVAKDSQAFY